jgi:hypothetical protein
VKDIAVKADVLFLSQHSAFQRADCPIAQIVFLSHKQIEWRQRLLRRFRLKVKASDK